MQGGRRWLWPLMLGFGLGSFAWNLCAPFLALRIQELGVADLGEVARQAGFLVGCSSLLNAALAPAWSWVGARSGFRWQVLRAHTGTAIGWTLFGLASTPLHMAGAAVALGGLSGNYPHYVALVAARSTAAEMGRAVGDLQAASQIGNTLGPLVGGLIASRLGVQSTFFVSAGLSLVAVAMALALVPADSVRGARRSDGESMGTAWRRPQQRWLMAFLVVADTGIIGLRPLVPVVLRLRLDDPATLAAATGVTTTLATAGTIVGAIVVGRISRRIEPRQVLIATLPLAAICISLVPFAPNVPALITLWALAGLAGGATTPAAFAWLGRVAPRAAGGYALLASTSMATYAIGPVIMGQASTTSLDLPFYVAAGATAVAALMALTSPAARAPAPARLAPSGEPRPG
jgi:DHA1 family multidrug resistance protein-like MFS transporter